MVWLACLAVGLDVVGESGFGVFLGLFIKTFHWWRFEGWWLRMVTVRSDGIDKDCLYCVWFYR